MDKTFPNILSDRWTYYQKFLNLPSCGWKCCCKFPIYDSLTEFRKYCLQCHPFARTEIKFDMKHKKNKGIKIKDARKYHETHKNGRASIINVHRNLIAVCVSLCVPASASLFTFTELFLYTFLLTGFWNSPFF